MAKLGKGLGKQPKKPSVPKRPSGGLSKQPSKNPGPRPPAKRPGGSVSRPQRPSSRNPSYGGGGGGRPNYGGGGGGGGAATPPRVPMVGRGANRRPLGTPAPTPPAPVAPSLDKWLAGDTAYQQFLRGGQKTLGDFLNDLGRQRTEAGTTFQTSKRQMDQTREMTLEDMLNEYAARGLLKSGLYTDSVADYNRDWQQQMTTLEQQNAAFLADLLSQETNFKREQSLSTEAAKQEALRRRAERYGL